MGSALRRRRAGADGLQESLLGDEGAASSSMPSTGGQLIMHRPFSVEAFIQFVWQQWQALLDALQHCINALLGRTSQPELSPIQAERLEQLQQRLRVPYDGGNSEHQDLLRQLWHLAFPGVEFTGFKTQQWTEMGWQGPDPGTDFRGAGLYGLQNLLYLGNAHPKVFQQLQNKTNGRRADWEYPFAVAGLNLTYTLSDILGLQHAGGQSRVVATAAGRAFLQQLQASENAFEELYVTSFELLDATWLDMGASYMEFNAVLEATRTKLEQALSTGRVPMLDELRQRLRLAPLQTHGTWASAS